jgi:hypothetical protein
MRDARPRHCRPDQLDQRLDLRVRRRRPATKATETASADRLEFGYDGEGHWTQIREYTAGALSVPAISDTRAARSSRRRSPTPAILRAVVRTYTVTEAGQVVR